MAERTFYQRKDYDLNSKQNKKLFYPDSSADDENSNEPQENSSFYDNDNNIQKQMKSRDKKDENKFVNRIEEKIDRVKCLSQKLSKIQFQEKENPPHHLNKLETKFEVVEDNFHHAYETIKTKFNTLKEHAVQMKKRLEEESDNKEDLKRNMANKLNLLQTKVKSMVIEERDHFKFYADNLSAKLEAELIKCETEVKKDDDALLKNINDIKENIKVI